MAVHVKRAVALGALLTSFAAVGLLLAAGSAGSGEFPEEARERAGQLAESDAALTEAARGLSREGGVKRAQQALRVALDVNRRVASWLSTADIDGEPALASRIDRALRARFEVLDAVGSTLANPRSPLRDTLRRSARKADRRLRELGLDADVTPLGPLAAAVADHAGQRVSGAAR